MSYLQRQIIEYVVADFTWEYYQEGKKTKKKTKQNCYAVKEVLLPLSKGNSSFDIITVHLPVCLNVVL